MPDPDDSPSTVETDTSSSDVNSQSSGETTETEGESRETLLSAITKAIAPDQGEASEAGPRVEGQGQTPVPGAEAELPEDISSEELNAYRPRTRKRIEQLIHEREGLRTELSTAQAQARATIELQQFLRTEDISREDFGVVLDLASAIRRGDFETFLRGVAPYVQHAQESLGLTIPQDLLKAVQTGHMSEDAARYTARQRAAALIAAERATRIETSVSQREHAEQVETFTRSVESAVATWEKGIKRQDPDYTKKEPLIRDLLPAVVQEYGAPQSEAQAVQLAEAAYTRANQILGQVAPRPRPTYGVPSSINRVNGAMPAPTSMLEAAQQALARSR